jgi:AraC family transcriptional regulator of adaptative response/methylated-DNA-[protein]-cysteine methyltransferase
VSLLRRGWPRADLHEDTAGTARLAGRIFAPLARSKGGPLALLVKGTNFQVRIWQALLTLPPGAVTTYGQLAHHVGEPRSARAVGNAVGANAIAWLIPCHRVIRESGDLSHYRWGETRKTAMLGWEAARYAGDG